MKTRTGLVGTGHAVLFAVPLVLGLAAVSAAGRLVGPEVHVLVSTRDFGAGYRITYASLSRFQQNSGQDPFLDFQASGLNFAGVRVGLTVLAGLGGTSQEDAHREATVRTIAMLPLTSEDFVHLSPLTPDDASALLCSVCTARLTAPTYSAASNR